MPNNNQMQSWKCYILPFLVIENSNNIFTIYQHCSQKPSRKRWLGKLHYHILLLILNKIDRLLYFGYNGIKLITQSNDLVGLGEQIELV